MRTYRWSVAVAAFALVLSGARPSHAQEPAPPGQAAGTGISEQAKRHFNAGVTLLQDPEGEKVEEAYRQFKTAYDLSGSPKILGNMAFCAMRLERDGEAIDAYSRYLREVTDVDPEERAQIVRDLQTLSVGVARLSLEVNTPGALVIDERVPVRGPRVTNTYGPATGTKIEVGVRPGHHVFTVKHTGHEDATWEVEAYAGSKDQHAFVLKDQRAPSAPREEVKTSIAGPIVVAAGSALLVGGAITGVIALGKTRDIADHCPNDRCPRSYNLDSERSSARTFVAVTDVLLAVGAVALLGGLYWVYRTSSAPKPQAQGLFGDWRMSL